VWQGITNPQRKVIRWLTLAHGKCPAPGLRCSSIRTGIADLPNLPSAEAALPRTQTENNAMAPYRSFPSATPSIDNTRIGKIRIA